MSETFVNSVTCNHNLTLGQNKCPEWNIAGIGDPRVALFFKLVRGFNYEELKILMSKIISSPEKDIQCLVDIIVLSFQTRNCRGGKGEKDLFYYMFIELYKKFPKTIINLVEFIPYFGYYKDFWNIIDKISVLNDKYNYESLIDAIYTFNATKIIENNKELDRVDNHNKLENEKYILDSNYTLNIIIPNLNLVAKYVPRQNKKFAKKNNSNLNLFKYLFPDHVGLDILKGKSIEDKKSRWNYVHMKYRKMISRQNKALNTTEIYMAANKFAEINFSKVASLCLNRHRKAFLNEKLKEIPTIDQEDSGNRHPDNIDRINCRQQIIQQLSDPKQSKNIKGGQLFPHEIVKNILENQTGTIEKRLYDAQWNSLLDQIRVYHKFEYRVQITKVSKIDDSNIKRITLGQVVAMVDVSGSMYGIPIYVAVALGIICSQLAGPGFKDRCITFSDKPEWCDLSDCPTIYDKVIKLKNINWAMNTNFEASMDLILDVCVENKISYEQIPNLLVLSDMQFDQAIYPCYWDERPIDLKKWETMHQTIVYKWSKSGYTESPNIYYWNLRSDTVGFPVQDNTPGTSMIAGYSPSLMKLILQGEELNDFTEVINEHTGEIEKVKKKITPYNTFRHVVDDEQYNIIRKIISNTKEGVFIDYEF